VVPGERGFRLLLEQPAYGVAPGQAAVLYEGDALVGVGTITLPKVAETSPGARALKERAR
jgi:tRNA-specific 2-thiouridylase